MHNPDVPLLPRNQPDRPAAPPAPDVLLVLRPQRAAVPADHRLKQLLKLALRRFGFRAVRCEDVRQDAAQRQGGPGVTEGAGPPQAPA